MADGSGVDPKPFPRPTPHHPWISTSKVSTLRPSNSRKMTWPFPPEITARIVSLLEKPLTHIETKLGLAQYASVNRDWQPIVEERSWAKLHIKTGTPLNLDQLERLTKDPRRQSYIRDIEFIVELDPYDEAARAHFETESEHERNNQIFSDAIRSILQTVAKWRSSQGISLSFKAQSPSDLGASPNRRW